MKQAFIVVCGMVMLAAATSRASAESAPLPPHNTASEDISEQRRLVSVRIERRLTEPELLRIGEAIRVREKRQFSRTQIGFFLPGMALQQGAWASVTFSSESKVSVHGLRREDEDVLLAEHRADTRPLLGSWLTSPPAAPGRLTIYSDQGRIYAEWRLRNGQRTVDELTDSTSKSVRRFDVSGGGFYVLAKSGDLEIWDKLTLIATAERIRPEHLALPAAVALGAASPPSSSFASTAPNSQRPAKQLSATVVSPAQPEPPMAAGLTNPSNANKPVPISPVTEAPAVSIAAADPEIARAGASKEKPRKTVKARSRPATAGKLPAKAHVSRDQLNPTPGDQIAAKLGRQ